MRNGSYLWGALGIRALGADIAALVTVAALLGVDTIASLAIGALRSASIQQVGVGRTSNGDSSENGGGGHDDLSELHDDSFWGRWYFEVLEVEYSGKAEDLMRMFEWISNLYSNHCLYIEVWEPFRGQLLCERTASNKLWFRSVGHRFIPILLDNEIKVDWFHR